MALRSDGEVFTTGANDDDQCEVPELAELEEGLWYVPSCPMRDLPVQLFLEGRTAMFRHPYHKTQYAICHTVRAIR